MQENFIPQHSLKALIDNEQGQCVDAIREEEASSVVMASFDTFHTPPSQGAKPSNKELDYQAGFTAGKAEAHAVYEATIKVMEATLESLKSGFQAQIADIEESHGRLVLRCLEAVLPEVSNHILISELQAVLTEAAGQNLSEGVAVHLHPSNSIAKDFLSEHAQSSLIIVEDNTQTETGVTVCWENSRTDIDPMGIARQCVSRLGGQPIIKTTDSELGQNHE